MCDNIAFDRCVSGIECAASTIVCSVRRTNTILGDPVAVAAPSPYKTTATLAPYKTRPLSTVVERSPLDGVQSALS